MLRGVAPPRPRRLGPALLLLGFAQLIITADFNIVYVALPEIGTALGFTAQTLQWVISAYAVAFGGLLVLGGRAADLFGPPTDVRAGARYLRRGVVDRWSRP